MSAYLTKEGLEKLQQELDTLKNVARKEVINRIKTAREQGDLSENAEYSDAKDQQSFIEGRILELENTIRSAVLIEPTVGRDGTVGLGMTVTINCEGDHGVDERRYTIVGSNEANPTGGRISNESPLGRAFIGKRLGETVEVRTPKGMMRCTIVHVAVR